MFSIPLILGTLFQQLYSFVDTVMVGRFLGDTALAAVGTTYSMYFLVLGFTGICLSNPMAWACGLVYCGILLQRVLKKHKNG